MAVGTEEATFNAAVDTLMAAWETFCDHVDANETIQIAFVASQQGDNANNSKYGADTTAVFETKSRKFRVDYNPDVTGDVILQVGKRPLFWKLTNDAGEI